MPKEPELDMNKYARMFVSESGECLRIMNDSLLELENDPGNKELIDKLFRAAHTIKGMAGMMGYKAVQDTAHEIENVLGAIRDGHLVPTGKISEALFEGFDALDVMVASVEKGEPLKESPSVVQALIAVLAVHSEEEHDDASSVPPTVKTEVRRVEKGDKHGQKPVKDTVTVVVKLGRRCSLPSARATVIIRELAKYSEVVESNPTEAEIEKESVFEELSVVLQPGDRLQDALRRVVAMSDVEQLLVGPTNVSKEKWQKMARQEPASTAVTTDVAHVQTVKVGMDKLDDLLDNVGELVIGRSRLLQKASTRDDYELLEISALIDKLTSDIQTRVLGIRMIPLDMVMSRFPRMVRDIAKNEGKEVELVVESGNIELDRTVADKIAEPMVHLLRNCVDHGIETVEERTKVGKRPKGLIRIVASKQQDHVLIEVSDDGKGIDFDSVWRAAVAKGIMNALQVDSA